jgi:hypothetical protein
VPTAAQKGPAGEITLLGSIGFDGKATVVCMGRVRLIPHVLIEGPGAFPAEIDTRLSDRSAPARRPYRTPRTQPVARQLCLQRDFWEKGVVGYREAPAELKHKRSSRDLEEQ